MFKAARLKGANELMKDTGLRVLEGLVSMKSPFWDFPEGVVNNLQDLNNFCTELAGHYELVETLSFNDNAPFFRLDNQRLFETMATLKMLKVLSLVQNGLGDVAAKHLAQFIKESDTCVSIDLSLNKFGPPGVKLICDELKNNEVLLSLKMTNNKEINNDAMQYFAEMLLTNHTLETINLSKCGFDTNGEARLVTGISNNRNQSLQELIYSHIKTPNVQITEQLKDNKLKFREKFLRELKTEETGKWNRSKLMFIGQGRAGKTSTVNRLLGKGFSPEQKSTVGANVKQTQTSTTADAKWAQVDEDNLMFLGKGMKQDVAAQALAAKKILFKKPAKKNLDEKERNRRLEYERKRRDEILRNRKANRKNGDGFDWDDSPGDPNEEMRRQDELLAMQMQREEMDLFDRNGRGGRANEEFRLQLEEEDRKRKEKGKNDNEEAARVFTDTIFKHARETQDTITFSLWDYGGQTVFYALHHLFLTKYGIYILCVDMREILGKPDVAKEYLSFWLNSVKLHASTAPVLIVGTHLDALQKPKEEIPEVDGFLKANFPSEKFSQIICLLDNDLCFYPVDNLNNKGVDFLRFDIERISRMQDFVTAEVSLKWLYCLDKMMVFKDHVHPDRSPQWLKLNVVKDIAGAVNLNSHEELNKMLKLFHELGVLVHLTGTQELSSLVTLDPQWLIDGLCQVIRDDRLHGFSDEDLKKAGLKDEMEVLYRKGLATRDVMNFLWRGETFKNHTDFFLDLMKYMVLISDWDFKPEKMYVIPSLLEQRLEEVGIDLFKDIKPDLIKDNDARMVNKDDKKNKKKKSELQDPIIEPEVLVLKEEKLTDFAVFDFQKKFLPVGVFQRLVCLCVSYSTSIKGTTGTRVREPELSQRYAKIWMGDDTILYVEQRKDTIWLSVEDPVTAPTCFNAIRSMLSKLNADLMGRGLEWDISFRSMKKVITQVKGQPAKITESMDKYFEFDAAQKQELQPWFEQQKAKPLPVRDENGNLKPAPNQPTKAPELINLDNFIDSF